MTFVSPLDGGYYVEHGLTYYTVLGKLDITPGHKNAAGERYRVFDPNAAILRCFQCHSTGPLSIASGDRIVPSEPGVRCEACHGPGAEHARTQSPSAIRNPSRFSAAELNDACGACHRMPATAGQTIDWSDPWNVRHQPLSLARAACFTKSNGALTCLTCHDAHAPLSRDTAAYDRLCSSCHAKPAHKAAVANKSCTGCHMPKVEPRPGLRFANHWIGVFNASNAVQPRPRQPVR